VAVDRDALGCSGSKTRSDRMMMLQDDCIFNARRSAGACVTRSTAAAATAARSASGGIGMA